MASLLHGRPPGVAGIARSAGSLRRNGRGGGPPRPAGPPRGRGGGDPRPPRHSQFEALGSPARTACVRSGPSPLSAARAGRVADRTEAQGVLTLVDGYDHAESAILVAP